MAPKKKPICRQEDFLYELEWTEAIDDYFVELLTWESSLHNFDRNGANTLALLSCQELIQHKFDKWFSYKHLNKKMMLLKKRFVTFHWILSQEGVAYNATTNIISVSKDVWKDILKTSHYAGAYNPVGEIRYHELKCIFGSDPVVNPNDGEEIIVLSSDDEEPKKDEDLNVGGVANPIGADRFGVNAHAFDLMAQQEFANVGRTDPKTVINISSGVWGDGDLDMMPHPPQNYVSDSEGSRDTEVSTANSRFVDQPSAKGSSMLRSRADCANKFMPFGTPKSSTASNKPPLGAFYTPENNGM